MNYEEKKVKLKQMIREYAQSDCIVAFSGGVDSSLLLRLVCEAAGVFAAENVRESHVNVYAVTMQTQLHPVREIKHAAEVAVEIGAQHLVIPVDELLEAEIGQNPPDRCYRCKKHLFRCIQEAAKERNVSSILEGTNADDLLVYRPGLKAIRELGVASPMADAGFTKADVRRMAAEYGLSVSDRPAVPCMATRFPYGTELSYEKLYKVEQGENYLKGLGLYNVRMRVHEETVRIEVDPEEFEMLLAHREEAAGYLKELGYRYITLDLEGFRSGSMDIGLQKRAGGV